MAEIKLISLSCPDCGGEMEVSPTEKTATCPYCGHSVLIEKREKPEPYKRPVCKTPEPQKKRFKKGPLIAVAVILGLFILSFVVNPEGRALLFPKTADPFEGLEVTFSGVSGDGTLSIRHDGRDGLGDVRFIPSKDRDLSNGDTVVVTAERMPGFRWEPAKKTYTVSGLTAPLTRLSDLPAAETQKLRHNSQILLDRAWEDLSARGVRVTWETKPYARFLLEADSSDARRKNLLMDAYVTVVTKEDGSVRTFWQAVCYPDVMLRGDSTAVVDYAAASLENWNLGYTYGYAPSSALYGWETADEMEAEFSGYRNYKRVDRAAE